MVSSDVFFNTQVEGILSSTLVFYRFQDKIEGFFAGRGGGLKYFVGYAFLVYVNRHGYSSTRFCASEVK